MALDRKTADELTSEIISLISNDEFKRHWPAAMAAMVLFARNMSEDQQKTTEDINEIFAKNTDILRAFIREFHALAAASAKTMLFNIDVSLRRSAEDIITNSKAEAIREIKKSTTEQMVNFNEKVPIVALDAIKKAIKIESSRLQLLHADYIAKTTEIEDKLQAIVDGANTAIERFERTALAIESQTVAKIQEKGFFKRLGELFFGVTASPPMELSSGKAGERRAKSGLDADRYAAVRNE